MLFIQNIDDLKAAFELMGDGIALIGDDFYSLNGAIKTYNNVLINMTHEELLEKGNQTTGVIIYGKAGFHRYFVKYNGSVCFSAFHSQYHNTKNAEALGFEIFI